MAISKLLLFLLLGVPLLVFVDTAAAELRFPLPPIRTPVQIAVIEQKKAKAKVASEAATPHVLAFFASADFRRAIQRCCPEAAALLPEELLKQLRAEVNAAEYAHAFPVKRNSTHVGGGHFTIELGLKYQFLLNPYQANIDAQQLSKVRDLTGLSPDRVGNAGNALELAAPGFMEFSPSSGAGRTMALAEENIFGLPPFKNESNPTWEEAADRLVYVAQNLRRVDFGSAPTFGDATIIFNNNYVRDMILAAPVDTGLYEMLCNGTAKGKKPPLKPNCRGWTSTSAVATWDHFDHLILENLEFWRLSSTNGSGFLSSVYDEAQALFQRSAFGGDYARVPNITSLGVMKYWETNVVGNVRFPEGVRFVIGSFPSLFGTLDGHRLQDFARRFGWPMVWSLAQVPKWGHFGRSSAPLNHRVLDPTVVASPSLNITLPDAAHRAFEALWNLVAQQRQNASDVQWRLWWEKLALNQIQLAPATARRCAASDSCIGSELKSGICLCKRQQQQEQQQRLSFVV